MENLPKEEKKKDQKKLKRSRRQPDSKWHSCRHLDSRGVAEVKAEDEAELDMDDLEDGDPVTRATTVARKIGPAITQRNKNKKLIDARRG